MLIDERAVTFFSHVLEPELCDKHVDVDYVLAWPTVVCQILHGKLQYCGQRTSQRLYLANDTCVRQGKITAALNVC